METDLHHPLIISHDDDWQCDDVSTLFSKESDHRPCLLSIKSSDSRLYVRRRAVSIVSQAKFSYNLDPFLVYLSVNYVDRFLSKHEILEKKHWISNILVVSSLSLAAKMRNSDISISLSDLKKEEGFMFDAQAINRMETIVLAALQWRMRSITPFSFLDYFISRLEIKDSKLTESLKLRASDIIFNVQHELKLLEHKPSTIAASAILCAVQDSIPQKFSPCKATIFSCEYLKEDKLLDCFSVIQDTLLEGYDPFLLDTGSGTLTPVSVLDQHQCTSSRSENSSTDSGFQETDNTKRRRLNYFYNL